MVTEIGRIRYIVRCLFPVAPLMQFFRTSIDCFIWSLYDCPYCVFFYDSLVVPWICLLDGPPLGFYEGYPLGISVTHPLASYLYLYLVSKLAQNILSKLSCTCDVEDA